MNAPAADQSVRVLRCGRTKARGRSPSRALRG